jgi:hypothetical protein
MKCLRSGAHVALAITALLFSQGCKAKSASSSAASNGMCLVVPEGAISDSGVGILRLGVSAAEIRKRCQIVRDTVMVNGDYVEAERALFIGVGSDTVRAWIPNDSITGIDVLSDRLSTQDSLRVGVTLAQLRGIAGLAASSGEASTWLRVPRHCGLALVISGSPGMDGADAEATEREIRSWPDTIRVTMIQISGCRDTESAPTSSSSSNTSDITLSHERLVGACRAAAARDNPKVHWVSDSALTGDLNYDGSPELVVWGNEGNRVVVIAIVECSGARPGRMWRFPLAAMEMFGTRDLEVTLDNPSLGEGYLQENCMGAETTAECRHLYKIDKELEAAYSRGGRGLRIGVEDRDHVYVYWDPDLSRFVSWRP